MMSLLKADFRRVFKDKLMIVMVILAVIFALTTPLIYALVFSGMDETEMELISLFLDVSGKAQFFDSFSLTNNLGLIAPVLLAIVLCKDFSHGTVRNKIIAGRSRVAIYFSTFVTCSTVLIGIMLLQGLLTLGISLLFFEYQSGSFAFADLWYFAESLAFELLILLLVSAILTWLCTCMKNVGLVIVLYVAAIFSLSLESALLQTAYQVMEWTNGNEFILSVLRFADKINIMSAAAMVGKGTSYRFEDVCYITIPTILGILAFTGFGILQFRKKDIK